MSGPVVPPLEVTEVDGSPDGRPITKIIVSNGDLSISGRTATIDTSGSGGTPGGSTTQVQYNNAGAFGGVADFIFTNIGAPLPRLEILSSTTADKASYGTSFITLDGSAGPSIPQISTTTGDQGLLLTTGTEGLVGPSLFLDTNASPSQALLANGTTDGTITIRTTAGTGDITIDANGDLHLKADLTLALTAATTASVTSTTTDNDMNFNIIADGTGTPIVKLENDTMAVQTICEANKKFTIEGGNGGDTFVFDVSSASGGVTFPDGTEQTTAATGGGGWIAIPTLTDVTFDLYNITIAAPYGISRRSTDSLDDAPSFFPFYSPESGAVAAISIRVTSAAGSACNALVGLYNQSAGIPTTKIAECAIDVTSTGDIRQTSFTGTPTLAKDSLYFVGIARSELVAVTLATIDNQYASCAGPVDNAEDQKMNLELQSSSKVLPATVDETDLQTTYTKTPVVLLEW